MLYEMLCGRTPFDPESGTLSELFMLLATADPKPLDELRSGLPRGLSDSVAQGLAKDPGARYPSSVEMAGALARFADPRSELVLRQLLQRHSGRVDVGPGPSLTPVRDSGAGSVAARPSGAVAAASHEGRAAAPASAAGLPASGRGETQRGWLSSRPAGPVSAPASGATGTAPGVGVTGSDESRSWAPVWAVTLLALAHGGGGAALLLQRFADGDDEAALEAGETRVDGERSGDGTQPARSANGEPAVASIVAPAAERADAGAMRAATDPSGAPDPKARDHEPRQRDRSAQPSTTPPSTARPTPRSPPPGRLRLRDLGADRGR
jgi:hypothetical protein